jgi:hypothetical protein
VRTLGDFFLRLQPTLWAPLLLSGSSTSTSPSSAAAPLSACADLESQICYVDDLLGGLQEGLLLVSGVRVRGFALAEKMKVNLGLEVCSFSA